MTIPETPIHLSHKTQPRSRRPAILTLTAGLVCLLILTAAAAFSASAGGTHVATVEQAVDSNQDLWTEEALQQPGGPSYQFFANLLPPLRYVDASFHYYPIVLSAPGAMVKARLVSNGGSVNALARQPNWRGEIGIPMRISVARGEYPFGGDLTRLDGPKLADGYLPVVNLRYRQGAAVYTEEAFAGVSKILADCGTVFLRLGIEKGQASRITLHFEGTAPYKTRKGILEEADGAAVAVFDKHWTYNPARNTLTALLRSGESAVVAILSKPDAQPPLSQITSALYSRQRQDAAATWRALVARAMQVHTPEQVVNNAWRGLIVGSYSLLAGDDIRYSAGNQYAKLYEAEGSDAARSLLLWGYAPDVSRMIVPLLEFTRKGLEYHQAACKLETLAHYYWTTRDADYIRAERPRWQKEVNLIANGREASSGLLPREQYCGDIPTPVYSLSSNSTCWRALRDWSAVLDSMGERSEGEKLAAAAKTFRKAILAALNKSIYHNVSPPFIPVALFGEEKPYGVITSSRMGSYWNLMENYVLGSGVFPYNSQMATWLIDYVQTHGGRCMGLLRSMPAPTLWVSSHNINDLYGMRYTTTLLERDEPDLALCSFYGKLAQGMTWNTFIGSEGSSIVPLDRFGRQMYLPPNSASNAMFLWTLRYLLVQDWDLNDDGTPDTLRLLFATPRAWLADGKSITVKGAPTDFGPVSVSAKSQLKQGRVLVDVSAPPHAPQRSYLRLRLPDGWRVASAWTGHKRIPVSNGETLDITGLTGTFQIRAEVGHK